MVPILLHGGGWDVLVELLLALELPFKVAAVGAGSAPGRSQPRVWVYLCALDAQCWWQNLGKFTQIQENSLLLKGTFLRAPTLSRNRDRPGSQQYLDICGEMRDGVGTSLLSGKSQSWLGSAHESNKKTYSGEDPTEGSILLVLQWSYNSPQ